MQVEHVWNPIALTQDKMIVDVTEGLSPNQIILSNALMFSRPVMCMVNGSFWGRKDWDYPVPVGGEVRFVELPRGGGDSNPLKIIAIIAVVVAAYYTGGLATAAFGSTVGSLVTSGILIAGSMLIGMMFGADAASNTGGDYGSAKTIYSVSGGSNRLRIGEPFAEHFGRMIVYPDLVQVSYTRMEGNEQYLYFYGIIGVGTYAIEGVYVDKTPIGEYAGTSYNILPPGHGPQIIPDVVWSSSAISGQDVSTTWLNAIVSGPGTVALYIEYDVQFHQLIAYDDAGNAGSASVALVTEARTVDVRGNATGGWMSLHTTTYTAASSDTLRYSNKIPAPAGAARYEFRIMRSVPPSTDAKVADKVSIVGLRAYGDKHPGYGDVTMIEARIKATDQLNGDVASKLNLIVTRQLFTVTNFGLTTVLAPTRSIVDAIAYVITAVNGGNQPQTFINFQVLNGLKTKLDSSGITWFDWRFTGRTTVMEACVKIAQCGRAVPYMPGGQFAVARDEIQALPKMVYTEDDYDLDSLNLVSTFPTEDSPTCVVVKYIDPDTWQDEQVTYFDILGSNLTPNEIVLEGCTNRQQAWEMASYLYRDMVSNTMSVEFTTGLKGHLPALFNKIAVSMTNVDWGQSGRIAAVEPGVIWTTEPLFFGSGSQGKMYISDSAGMALGPYTVTKVNDNPYQALGTIPNLKELGTEGTNATPYIFGPFSIDPLFVRVMHIAPQGRNKVKLIGTIVTDEVYEHPGAADSPQNVLTSGDPLSEVFLSRTGYSAPNHSYSLSWVGSAVQYKIEIFETSWVTMADHYSGYQTTFAVPSSAISIRMTPYDTDNLTILPSYQKTTAYAQTPAAGGLTLVSMDANTINIAWTAVSGVSSYDVSIMVSGVIKGSRRVYATQASVTTAELTAVGGPWGDFYIIVNAIKGTEKGADSTLHVTVSPLAAPSTPVLQSLQGNGFIASWGAVTDATGYVAYIGTTSNFDAKVDGILVYTGATPSALLTISMTTPYNHYVRVAATNGYYTSANRANLVFSPVLAVTHA